MKQLLLLLGAISILFQNSNAQDLSIQTGHSAAITDLVFSPDGNYLASAGEDSKVIIWDMTSAKQMTILSGHTKSVNSIAMHPTKNIIASASDDNKVKLWEYPSGKIIKTFYFFEAPVKSVAFSPDGNKLACGSNQVYIIDLKTDDYKNIGKYSKKGYNALAYSNDGRWLAFGGKKTGQLYEYSTEYESIRRKTRIHTNDVIYDDESQFVYAAGQGGNIKRVGANNSFFKRKFNISANNSWNSFNAIVLNKEYFIGANKDNLIYIYNRRSGAREEILIAHTDEVRALALDPEGRYMASAGDDRKIFIWDLQKKAVIKKMEGGANRVNSISFSSSGKLMFIGYNDGSFRIWNLDQKGKVITQSHNKLSLSEKYFRYKYAIDESNEPINTNKILVKANLNQKDKYSEDYKIKESLIIWKLKEGMRIRTLKSPKSTAYQSFLLKDTSEIYLFKSKGTHSQKYSFINHQRIRNREEVFSTVAYKLYVTNLDKNKKLRPRTFKHEKLLKINGDLYFKTLDPTGERLLTLLNARKGTTKCEIWNIPNKEIVQSYESDEKIDEAGYSTTGKYIYLTFNEIQKIKLFDATTFTEVAEFQGNAPVSFDPDDQQISYIDGQRNFYLADINSKTEIFKTQTGHSAVISDIKFNTKYNYIATSSHDGLIRLWDIKSGELLVSLAAFDEDDFIYITSDNYYYSTKGAMNYIGFIENERLYTFEQFDVKFNRPDIVFSKLSYSTPDEIAAYQKAYQKRVQKMGFGEVDISGKLEIPEIKIVNLDDFPISTFDNTINLKLAASDSIHTIDRINIWVNDVPVFGVNGYSLKERNLKNYTNSFPITLSTGRNKIQVSSTNSNGFESLKETFSIIYDIPESKPDLYILSIGVSQYVNPLYDLQYAAKDAEDISGIFQNENKQFQHVYVTKVLNKDATVENILKLKSKLENTRVDDVVLLFFAGHGVLDNQMNYYLATTEINVDNMAGTALRYDELEGLFDGIPARKKVIIIDACHSGEVDKEEEFTDTELDVADADGFFRNIQSAAAFEQNTKITTQSSFELMKMMFADIRKGTGSTVISSAGGGEYAYETEKTKNGVFTYVIINGILSKKADLNKDGNIMVSELRDYASSAVSKLTKGLQNPTSRRENLEFDFKIW